MQITQQGTDIFVSVFNITTPGRIVGYTPSSVEFYRAPSLKTGTWTDTISTMGLVPGTYWFFLYDANNVVIGSEAASINITTQTSTITFTVSPQHAGWIDVLKNGVTQGMTDTSLSVVFNVGDTMRVGEAPNAGYTFSYYINPDGTTTNEDPLIRAISTGGPKQVTAVFIAASAITVDSITSLGLDIPSGMYKFQVVIGGSGSGSIQYTDNGVVRSTSNNVTPGTYVIYFSLIVGTHTICAEVI